MKFGKTKWCYKCGGTKMKQGGHFENNWSNNIGFGQVIERRNLDQLPFFRSGGRVIPKFQEAGLLSENEFTPSNNWQSPLMYGYTPSQNPMGSTTERALEEGRAFLTRTDGEKEQLQTPNRKPNWMTIGNAMNFGVGALSELAGIYDRNMQQDYVNKMQNNPLSGILPFDDMRSDRVEEGYIIAKDGGLFANYWAKRRRGEAAGTSKPNKSSASKEEWERSAKTAKKKYGGTNLKHYKY